MFAAAGCTLSTKGKTACEQTADCISGYTCVERMCTASSAMTGSRRSRPGTPTSDGGSAVGSADPGMDSGRADARAPGGAAGSGKPPGGPSDAASPSDEGSSTPPEQTDGDHDGPSAMQAGTSGGSAMDVTALVMDAALPLDAGPDTVEDGARDGGDGGIVVDPCADGSLRCAPVAIVVFGDWKEPALPRATIVVTAAEHTFRGEVADGFVTLDLPIERELWLHVTADGYLPTDMPRWIEREGRVDVMVFSKTYVKMYLGLFLLEYDEGTGVVLALVERPGLPLAPPLIGAGMDLDRPHDGPFAADGEKFVASNVLLSGGTNALVFLNVSPGAFTPSWISPPGYACAGPIERGQTIAADTTLITPIFCHELDADAGPLE